MYHVTVTIYIVRIHVNNDVSESVHIHLEQVHMKIQQHQDAVDVSMCRCKSIVLYIISVNIQSVHWYMQGLCAITIYNQYIIQMYLQVYIPMCIEVYTHE